VPLLLTMQTQMKCPHGGTVVGIPTDFKNRAGAPFLRVSDVFLVAGCPFMTGPVPTPCITVQWMMPAMKVRGGGVPILTKDSVGMCIGPLGIQGPVQIQDPTHHVKGQ